MNPFRTVRGALSCASGATNRDGSSTWDGVCSVDGTTATITG
jgi:hypothetical protein